MLIARRRGWELPESAATPEALALGRRAVLAGSAALALGGPALAAEVAGGAAPLNHNYAGGRRLTAEKDATT
jgi:sulfoxide reductase catalytic subunit YedY